MNVKPAYYPHTAQKKYLLRAVVLSQRNVPGSGKTGVYQGTAAGNLVTGTDCKHTMGERTSVCKDDLPVDLREIHRCEPESTAKKRRKPRKEGNQRKIQSGEDDPKAGQKRLQAAGVRTLGSGYRSLGTGKVQGMLCYVSEAKDKVSIVV